MGSDLNYFHARVQVRQRKRHLRYSFCAIYDVADWVVVGDEGVCQVDLQAHPSRVRMYNVGDMMTISHGIVT